MVIIKIFGIIGCGIFVCYCIRKLVESIINLMVYLDSRKNPNHEANSESTNFVVNKETKKLENASNPPKLPF